MAAPTADTLSVPAGTAVVYGGRAGGAAAPFTVRADGIWTWFTAPEAIQLGDYLYVGWVDSTGKCGATQVHIPTQAVKQFDLSSAIEIDDHNNASMLRLSDGRIVFFFGTHNDQLTRYRIYDGSGDFADAASWGAVVTFGMGQGPYSYPNPCRLSNDPTRSWLFQRRWTDGTANSRALAYRSIVNLGDAGAVWGAYNDVVKRSNFAPYWRLTYDGVGRVHVAITDGHPQQGQISLYHLYGDIGVGGAIAWFKSDGAPISASLPMAPTDASLVYDGSVTRCWVSDCAIGPDARPRILYMRYPGNDGYAIEYWHARWTGAAWVSSKVTDDGAGLYGAERYYHGGLRFDANDVARVYLSAPISGVRHVQEWRSADSGATWSMQRALTSGGTAGTPLRARPVSPRTHDGRISVLWWEGQYTSYTSFMTDLKGAG